MTAQATASSPIVDPQDLAIMMLEANPSLATAGGAGAGGYTQTPLGQIPTNLLTKGQGLGSTYLNQLPNYLSGFNSGTLDPSKMGDDPLFQYFVKNGYLNQDGSMGYAAADLGLNPGSPGSGAVTSVGPVNFQAGQTAAGRTPQLVQSPANPFGASAQGSIDAQQILPQSKAPAAFGTDPGTGDPTVSPYDLRSNQDWLSEYAIPLAEMGAGIGFGAVGGFGDLGSAAGGLFRAAGNAVTGPSDNPLMNINPISAATSLAQLYGINPLSQFSNMINSAFKGG